MTLGPGGWIEAVAAGSLGEAAGLRPGDRLVAINSQPLRDIVDVQFYGAEETLDLVAERDGRPLRFQVERSYGQELGLTFANPTFDVDIRRCANHCDFCFVKQNAPGMRRSLYVKDDDYRYSFLFGNFVTLTNLTAEDWARLEEQRLSPLFVSVHASDPELRRRFLGLKAALDILAQLRRLGELGIKVHAQVVLVPGLNDGAPLDRTLADLTALYENPVASVSVVPIGLTKYHRGPCRTYAPAEARALLDQVEPWRSRNRQRWGCAVVYPSDEWYLVAGREMPPADDYDSFPQVENGVGAVRLLLEEWAVLKDSRLPPGLRPATLVCGTLISPVLAPILAELSSLTGADLSLVPVVNQFFGPVTTVSGLLTGQDVVAALQGRRLGERVLLPRAMFTGRYGAGSAPPGMTLDDWTLDEIAARLGRQVAMAGNLGELLAALQ